VTKRVPYDTKLLLFHGLALAGVVFALSKGIARQRLGPVVDFLVVGAAAASFLELTFHLSRRRARAQEARDLPEGVRLSAPLWMAAAEVAQIVATAGGAGALAAGAGFASVGVGIALTIVGLYVSTQVMIRRLGSDVTALTFDPEALRVHLRDVTFCVPWRAIASVERTGREDHRLNRLTLREDQSALHSAVPDTERNRRRVWMALGGQSPGRLSLTPWTAGVDGAVLARALRARLAAPATRAN
jgi:hypothetical protein